MTKKEGFTELRFHGMRVIKSDRLKPGIIEFRDKDGNTLGFFDVDVVSKYYQSQRKWWEFWK
ncbi:MAG: hypothetical protein NUV65_03020 [Candidatus Roizmanbacteria bacterium]|nr:hypothetical protein [Candidatus Roizmanbacteria bacterium]